jgi:hypothetical protein
MSGWIVLPAWLALTIGPLVVLAIVREYRDRA